MTWRVVTPLEQQNQYITIAIVTRVRPLSLLLRCSPVLLISKRLNVVKKEAILSLVALHVEDEHQKIHHR